MASHDPDATHAIAQILARPRPGPVTDLETGKGLKKGPETILKISRMFQAFCSGLFPETGPKIKKNQPEIMKDQENLAKLSQNQ